MDIYLMTLASGVLAVTLTSLALARLIPDDYDRRRPARIVAGAAVRRARSLN